MHKPKPPAQFAKLQPRREQYADAFHVAVPRTDWAAVMLLIKGQDGHGYPVTKIQVCPKGFESVAGPKNDKN